MFEFELSRPLNLRDSFSLLRHHGTDPNSRLGNGDFTRRYVGTHGSFNITVSWTSEVATRCTVRSNNDACSDVTMTQLLGLEREDPYTQILGRVDPDTPLSRWLRADRDVYYPATCDVWGEIVPAILGQRVTAVEASRQWRRLHNATDGLRPEAIATLAYSEFHKLGIEQSRARTLRLCATRISLLESLNTASVEDAYIALSSLTGVGAWTISETLRRSHGWLDAVSVGDFHLKHVVKHALTGAPTGSDDEMLSLLEPFRPARAVVIAAIRRHAPGPPKRAPGLAIPDIRRM